MDCLDFLVTPYILGSASIFHPTWLDALAWVGFLYVATRLLVGFPGSKLQHLCASWRPLARVDNRWHLDNEEYGRLIAACNLKHPLGSIWTGLIATDQL